MKKSRLLGTLYAGILSLGFVTSFNVSAAIVNINSITDNESNPVSISLDAGTYEVTPIGVADGGSYNAWNAWNGGQVIGCDSNGANCGAGWFHWYYFSSSEFGEISNWDGVIYANSSLALANSISTSFTLTSSAIVNFYVKDGTNGDLAWDNTGGISLNVGSPVPIPPTLYLFISGLVGLVAINKKKTK